jgi:hypothetical protein
MDVKSQQPMVSISVNYDPKLLAKCSIFNESHVSNFETLVVDNGSPKPLQILLKQKYPEVQLISEKIWGLLGNKYF